MIHGNNLPAIDRCLLYIHVHVHYLEQPIFMYIVSSILGGALILSLACHLSQWEAAPEHNPSIMYWYMYLCLASRALISWSSAQIVIFTHIIYCFIQKLWINSWLKLLMWNIIENWRPALHKLNDHWLKTGWNFLSGMFSYNDLRFILPKTYSILFAHWWIEKYRWMTMTFNFLVYGQ